MFERDVQILRPLAQSYGEYATAEPMREKERRCLRHNGLDIVKPLINIFEVPWGELAYEDDLQLHCEHPSARAMECHLRRVLYQMKHFPVDLMLAPYYEASPSILGVSYGISIHEETRDSATGSAIRSHSYNDMLPDEAALEKIKMPHLSIDQEKTDLEMDLAERVFSGILPVQRGGITLYSAMWDIIPMLHGANRTIEDLIDRPEFCHAAVEKFTQWFEHLHLEYERINVLSARPYYLHCSPALTDDLPQAGFDGEHVRLKDVWARGMAQIFAVVSPEMHDALDLQYMQRLFDMCGLSYYGCCEPVDTKIDILRRRFRNLRKISISPWADKRRAAEHIGGDYVASFKPNPAFVANGCSEGAVRAELEEMINVCQEHQTPLEIILKDISTVTNNVQALTDWANIVQDVVNERY